MTTLLIFVLCLVILIGLVWGALKFFKYLLKMGQAEKKPKSVSSENNKEENQKL